MRGFFSSSGALTNTYKHYLFDISMFTHLNILTAQAFTTGETVTGGTTGATGTVQSISATKTVTPLVDCSVPREAVAVLYKLTALNASIEPDTKPISG